MGPGHGPLRRRADLPDAIRPPDAPWTTARRRPNTWPKANEVKQSPSSAFLLGRLYFRLGTIHALGNHDHRTAVAWFDKAIPLLERPSPNELTADLGRHGETFVSMGVSYWEAGQREKAVALTEKGIKWMEQAVKQDTLRPCLARGPL